MTVTRKTLIFVVALSFALGALAGQGVGRNDGSRTIHLSEPTATLGVTLPPGEYTMRWSRDRGSEEVRIEIARGKKIVAAGKGMWIASAQASPYDAFVTRPGAGGASTLAEIRFRGSSDAIHVGAESPPPEEPAQARAGAK